MRDVFVRVYEVLVCGICVLALGSVGLDAQGSASISGKVLDPDSKGCAICASRLSEVVGATRKIGSIPCLSRF